MTLFWKALWCNRHDSEQKKKSVNHVTIAHIYRWLLHGVPGIDKYLLRAVNSTGNNLHSLQSSLNFNTSIKWRKMRWPVYVARTRLWKPRAVYLSDNMRRKEQFGELGLGQTLEGACGVGWYFEGHTCYSNNTHLATLYRHSVHI
jgi:hypothetical protein